MSNALAEHFGMLESTLPVPRETVAQILAEPARTIAPVNPSDPARLGYPPTFPFEIALRTAGTREICEAYNIDRDEWELIRQDPAFLADLDRAVKLLAEEGMSFKIKARLQAEELLKTSWRTIHDPGTPPNVRADLIKATMRWAEYDLGPGAREGATHVAPGAGFAININFQNQQATVVRS